MNYLAWNTWCAGDYPLARAYWREGMALCEQLALPFEKAWLLDCIGNDAWVEDDMPFAEQCVREALAIYTEVGHQRGIAFCHAELGWVLTSIGQVEQARVRTQPATWHFFKEKAAQLQAKIGEALPADVRTTAIARGQSSTVEAMVAILLEVVAAE